MRDVMDHKTDFRAFKFGNAQLTYNSLSCAKNYPKWAYYLFFFIKYF